MPEQEFEIYLSLLSRLLRLTAAQKAAISDELRDHLEQRLADLVAAGMSRDDAIKTAMDEFGDVTGLALDLTRVSRTPLRKVVVRSTIAASAVAVAVVGWLMLFVPEHRVAGPPVVQAQQDRPAGDPPKPRAAAHPAAVIDEELFPEFLKKQIDVNFEETPLKEVCAYLESVCEVPVMPHRSALQDEGIVIDTPVNLELKGLTFEEILNHLTRSLNLEWQVDGGLVQITTYTHCRTLSRQFDLRKLTKRGHSLNGLVEILRLGADNRWEEDGEGWATVLIGETLVVRQTYQNQRRFARLLAAIEPQQPQWELETCTGRERLVEVLREPTSFDYEDTPLKEVIWQLREQHQVPFLLDLRALNDEGITSDNPVALKLKNRPLGKLLEIMLAELQLSTVIRDGAICVTTRSKAEEDMSWTVYNVRDLAPSAELLTQLTDVIERTTNGKWMQVDQEGGELARTEVGGCLLVKQTDKVHVEIQSLLAQLRHSQRDQAGEPVKPAPQPKLVTQYYRMPQEIATDLSKALPNLVAPASWTVGQEAPRIELIASAPLLEQVDGSVSGGNHEVQVLNASADSPSAGKPGPPNRQQGTTDRTTRSVVVRPRSTLVIRQTPEVHRQIAMFLQSLGVNYQPGTVAPEGGGGVWRGGGGMGGGGMGGGGGFF